MSDHFDVGTEPLLINDTNLSSAWARVFLHVLDHVGTEVSPLALSVTGFAKDGQPDEDTVLRKALDDLLANEGKADSEGVAFTIFPQRIWEIAKQNRARLFALYKEAFPRYQAMNRRLNGRGMYFERMTMYGRGPFDGNQLEWVLSQYASRDGVRRSMFQATTFDPGRDHVGNAQLGFPCLQQVSFVPVGNGLVMNAFYATQQLFDKAYGNYLGLSRLGAFMAREMNLSLIRVNVNVGVAKLERITKTTSKLQPLIKAARECVKGGSQGTGSASTNKVMIAA